MSEAAFKGTTQSGCHRAAFALVLSQAGDLDALRRRMQSRDRRARRLIARVIDDEYFQSMGAECGADRTQHAVMISAGHDGAKHRFQALTNRIRRMPIAPTGEAAGRTNTRRVKIRWHWHPCG